MSVVRLEIDTWRLSESDRIKASEMWPELATEEKFPICKDLIVEYDEIPMWVGEIHAISIKPIKKIKFVRPDAPNLGSGNPEEVREFIKNVNQVVLPGYDLLGYNEIDYRENCCTTEIQHLLDEGWRIIAVLPQHGQRRPDYILVRKR